VYHHAYSMITRARAKAAKAPKLKVPRIAKERECVFELVKVLWESHIQWHLFHKCVPISN